MTALHQLQVIDVDSHVTEPADLWTARVPSAMVDAVPRVERRPADDRLAWRIGDYWGSEIGAFAMAGWRDFWPSTPPTYEEMDPAVFDARARVAHLDRNGIRAQVLYPNVLGFDSDAIMRLGLDVALACVRAYNDYLAEWASEAPDRLIPVMMVPFWDLDASVAEITRCREAGMHALLFAGHLERIGLPSLWDQHWDRLFAVAQEAEMSVNFHLGFSQRTVAEREASNQLMVAGREDHFDILRFVKDVSINFANHGDTIADLIMSGVCHRFPDLTLVSVESGFGYIPYLLDALDWQWVNADGPRRMPERLLPSEYFFRQVMATFWFESETIELLSGRLQDNVMFETDFPHQTSIAPGPASYSPAPLELIEKHLASVPTDVRQKVLFDNAARVYRVDRA